MMGGDFDMTAVMLLMMAMMVVVPIAVVAGVLLIAGTRRTKGSARAGRTWLYGALAVGVAFFVLMPATMLVIGACGGGGRDTSGDAVVQGGMEETVRIEDFKFQPGNLELPAGARVTWVNEDSAPHDATGRDADWETSTLSQDESETLTFDEPGEYDYYCSIHPSMKARLTVR